MVGAGAVVTRSVPPHAIVTGNPAHIKGYSQTTRTEARLPKPATAQPGQTQLGVGASYLQRFTGFPIYEVG